MTEEVTDEQYCEFYWAVKRKKDLAQQFGFGTGGALGSKFTESLCRYLYNLKTCDGSAFDALDGEKNVEIKATQSRSGTTSINMNVNFDILFWMHFDIDSDKLIIRKINGDIFRAAYKKYYPSQSTTDSRVNVTLNKVCKDLILEAQIKEEIYKFEKNTISK
ncbi:MULTISPECIES: hypothetical protein [Bacillus cereus group]|uniref:hypothetical protein n=1 Tax=Bacillus cereus group TaxID=86661 RepID=UPI001F2A58CC|nr:hypothetical protein [Bacillus cereus]MDA1521534.1 hypothetical protein [Bacillus cereus]BCC09367.1 hypothetical protein BCM0060_p2033 [Bacillus cereus]BCD08782.1 hypothetical protein BC30052_p2064 [Bacillus cereus]HDR7981666.1 Bsp6I family type II restriction endonuclease [Bacillus cereus]HDR8060267.1 Bsp6I family type II restriction endonuclease [Bacillus cereus]